MKKNYIIFFLSLCLFYKAQEGESVNSSTRKFINGADFTQINKDWNITADFRSGIGEQVYFFPLEAINLKTNQKMKSIQVNMNIKSDFMGKSKEFFKTSWWISMKLKNLFYYRKICNS